MIKKGTLCWLKRLVKEQACFNGRVVEVQGIDRIDDYGTWYNVTADWIIAENVAMGHGGWRNIAHALESCLQPFTDPGSDTSDSTSTPKEAVTS